MNFTIGSGFIDGPSTLDFALTDFEAPSALWVDNLAGTAVRAQAQGVPEPATWTMWLVGFGVVGVMLRMRRRVQED